MSPDEIQAALVAARALAARRDELAEWYSGNNPGKQERLDQQAHEARLEVRRLEALL